MSETEQNLAIDVFAMMQIETLASGGIRLHVDLTAPAGAQKSPSWLSADWQMQFLYLPAGAMLALEPGNHYFKVIVGTETVSGRDCFAPDASVRSTTIAVDGKGRQRIAAGAAGMLGLLVTQPGSAANSQSADTTVPAPCGITSMTQVDFTGAKSSALKWRSFRDRFGAVTEYFNALDNHMADGFHLVDQAAEPICYVNFWTCALPGDVSTHNHAHPPAPDRPPFAETHLVLANAGSASGMYLVDDSRLKASETERREYFPMQSGDEHGPFFYHDGQAPMFADNGAIDYPWHGWESRGEAIDGGVYDYVVAFEMYPEYVRLSRQPHLRS